MFEAWFRLKFHFISDEATIKMPGFQKLVDWEVHILQSEYGLYLIGTVDIVPYMSMFLK